MGSVRVPERKQSEPSEPHQRRGPVFVPLAYRIEDAAAAIGISRSTLFEYIKDGRIPSRKIGSSTVIRHCDLEAFLDAAPFSAATKDAQRSMS